MQSFWKSFTKTLGILSAIFIIILVLIIVPKISSNYINISKEKYEFIEGDKSSLNKIIILEINGLITNQSKHDLILLNSKIIYANEVEKIFHELSSESNLKAVIISINSPGGSVSGSHRLYNAIKDFKKNSKLPIFIHTNEILASGAVWSIVAADKIYASYGAMIGSIGVKGPSWFVYNEPVSMEYNYFGPNVSTLKGIDHYQPYAGRSKDIFNPFRKPTPEELTSIQEMLDSIYERFLNIVSKNRKIDKDYIKYKLGALVFDSDTAKLHNLIDDVASLNAVKKKIIFSLGLDQDYQILKIKNTSNFIKQFSNLTLGSKSHYNKQINSDICNLSNQQFLLISNYNFSDC